MYKFLITSVLVTVLTGTVIAAEKRSYSVSSKVSMSGGNLSHASKPAPSLSTSRCSRGMGSAFTPSFACSLAKHPTIGGTIVSADPTMSAIDISHASGPTPSLSASHSSTGSRGQEMNYVNGKMVPYTRRPCGGDKR